MNGKSLLGRVFAWPVRTFKRFGADRGAPMAASIAFYSAFSLAPTLVMVIAVAGLVFGAEAARGLTAAAIGPITAESARAAGMEVAVQPTEYTLSALTAAIHDFFTESKPL